MATLTATWDAAAAAVVLEYTPAVPVDHAWTGTPHASASTRTVYAPVWARRTNRVANPTLANDIAGYTATATALTRSTGTGAGAGDGTRLSMSVPAGTSIFNSRVTYNVPLASWDAGRWFGWGLALRRSQGLFAYRLILTFYDGGNASRGQFISPLITPGTAPLTDTPRAAFAALAPDGAARLECRIQFYNAAGTGDPPALIAHTDAWAVEDTATQADALAQVLDYFDGDTPDVPEDPPVAELIRADANGAGVRVRTLDGALPSPGPVVVRDFEAAAGLATYEAADAAGNPGPAVSLTVPLGGPRLASVLSPAMLALPELVTGYTATRTPQATVHRVIGRPDAVVVDGVLGARAGVLEVLCQDYAAARQVVSVYAAGGTVLLRQAEVPGLDLYHRAAGPLEERPAGVRGRWVVTVPYTEQRRPTGPLLGTLGWTWDAVATQVDTWDQLAQLYATWADVEVGPLT